MRSVCAHNEGLLVTSASCKENIKSSFSLSCCAWAPGAAAVSGWSLWEAAHLLLCYSQPECWKGGASESVLLLPVPLSTRNDRPRENLGIWQSGFLGVSAASGRRDSEFSAACSWQRAVSVWTRWGFCSYCVSVVETFRLAHMWAISKKERKPKPALH